MGFLDKILDVMRLNEDDYEFDNDDYEFDDDYEEEGKGKKPSRKERKEEQAPKRAETNFDMSEKRQKNTNKITLKIRDRGSKAWKYVSLNQVQSKMSWKLQIHY